MCDRKYDCADGSDEDEDLCNYVTPLPHTTSTSTSTSSPVRTTAPPIVFDDNSPDGSCRLGTIPRNSRVVLERDESIELHEDDLVSPYEGILYKCLDSSDITKDICWKGTWAINNPPECKKYCSGLSISHPTIKVLCEYNLQTIQCGAELNPTTEAKVSCEFGYQKPDPLVKSNIFCLENGQWDYPVWRCDQICGTGPERGVKYAYGGQVTNIVEVPWHAGLYNDVKVPGTFEQVCGGSIISSNIIISAAHCLWDESEKTIFPENNFRVGVGKSRRSFYEKEELDYQLLKIKKFYVHSTYGHASKLYLDDISILLLDGFIIFRPHVKPICLEYDLRDADLILPPNTTGIVAGWGYEETGSPSEDLKVIEIPYIDYHTCLAGASESYKSFIVSDKFCGGYLNLNLSVCRGDSGGGWVYSKMVNGKKRYFLRGIVSNGENLNNNCDPNKYTAFTSVEFFFEWILDKIIKYSPNAIPAAYKDKT